MKNNDIVRGIINQLKEEGIWIESNAEFNKCLVKAYLLGFHEGWWLFLDDKYTTNNRVN